MPADLGCSADQGQTPLLERGRRRALLSWGSETSQSQCWESHWKLRSYWWQPSSAISLPSHYACTEEELKKEDSVIHKMPVPKWGIKRALDFIAHYYAMFLPARKQLCYSSSTSKDNQPPVNTTYYCPGTICHFIQHLGETTPNKQHLVKQRNIHYSKRKNPTYNRGYDSAYKIRSTNLLGYAQPQMTMRLYIYWMLSIGLLHTSNSSWLWAW